MRTLSANQAKRFKNTVGHLPRPNSKLRTLYDKLQANRGKIVELHNLTETEHTYLTLQLPDFYGLDLRSFGRGRWCLCGEWFGTHYVDYIAERGGGRNG